MNKIIFWTSTIIIFLFEGMMPLSTMIFAPQYINVGTKALGYPDYFAYTLIFFKVLGSVALIIPKLPTNIKEWTYAGFTFSLIFAVISHLCIDGIKFVSFFPLIILVILGLSYYYSSKINHHYQKHK